MNRNFLIFAAFSLLLAPAAPAQCPGCDCPKDQQCAKAGLLTALPAYVNTPDGMALLQDGSIVVSAPNFNDESIPPLLVRVTGSAGQAQVEKFYEFPHPYPGLPAGLDRISPMGIVQAPSGDLYFADMQIRKDISQKSRLWKLVMAQGKPQRMVLVAKNFNVANGLCIRDGFLYITDSVLEPGANPLPSAVLRFRLDEENVELTTPLKNDPHIIATFTSKKMQWPFGADGIDFDNEGNLYVGLFGEGQMFKLTFDASGKVVSNQLFVEAPGTLINCDGMHLDKTTNKLYMADSAANAIQVIDCKTGKLETLVSNGDTTDKNTGGLDQPCEALVRGKEIVVSNMDWPFPGFKNSKWQMPATLSVISLPK